MVHLNIFGLALLICLTGYLFGSILFGSIVSKIKNVDIRSQGSGNVGATNTLRVMGKTYGMIVMLFDFFKAWFATFLSLILYKYCFKAFSNDLNLYSKTGWIIYLSGFCAVIGHCFPINYLIVLFKTKFDFKQAYKYSGGKGVASTGGFLASISPWVFLIGLTIFIIIVLISRYISLSSMISITVSSLLLLIPQLDYLYILNILDANILENVNMFETLTYDKHFIYILTIFFMVITLSGLIIYRHKSNIYRLKNKSENKIF